MTLSTPTCSTVVSGNGATTVFNYGFESFYQADGVTPALEVFYLDGGNSTLLNPSQYTVAGVGNPTGGTVTYNPGVPIPVGSQLLILSTLANIQPTAVENSTFYPHTVELVSDYITRLVQQVAQSQSLDVTVAPGQTPPIFPGLAAFTTVGDVPVWNGTMLVAQPIVNTSGLTPAQIGAYAVANGAAQQYAADVRQYGAIADGIILTDGAMSSTSNPTFLNSASASFKPSDIGKMVMVAKALGAQTDLVGTIVGRNSATQVVLSVSATATVVGARAYYGTDNYTAVTAAYASGMSVLFPANPLGLHFAISKSVSPIVNYQKTLGEGLIACYGVNGNSSAFVVANLIGTDFENIHVIPGTTTNFIFDGFGIKLTNCSEFTVRGIEASYHRRGGITAIDCSSYSIIGNLIHDSVVNSATDDYTHSGDDIYLANATSNATVSANVITRGCGIGVGVQTTLSTPGFTVQNVSITANVVDTEGVYGIMAYSDNDADNFSNVVISGNSVQNIYGNLNNLSANKVFGAGIYNQGCEHTAIVANTLRNCNVDTDTELLAPAAIGSTNCRAVVIAGNTIRDTVWYGIYYGDPNVLGLANGTGVIANNDITNSTKAALKIFQVPRANVQGNHISDGASLGIWVTASAMSTIPEGYIISNNDIVGVAASAIRVEFGNATMIGNYLKSDTLNGCDWESAGSLVFNENRCINNGQYGLNVAMGSSCRARDNVFDGNVYNVVTAIPITGLTDNVFKNAVTANLAGTYGFFEFALANAASPTITGLTMVTIPGPTAQTGFTGGVPGQIIIARYIGSVTVTNGAGLHLPGSSNINATSGYNVVYYTPDGTNWRAISVVTA